MKLKLIRTSADMDGVFGTLQDESGKEIAKTLEHAYDNGNAPFHKYVPKVAPGDYKCIRHAPNRFPYETFELQHVPPFQGKSVAGILLHIGNYNRDSDGCILLGRRIVPNPDKPAENMISSSKNTFNKFMDLLKDKDSFILSIE